MNKKTDLKCLVTGPIGDKLKAQIDQVGVLDVHDDVQPLTAEQLLERLKNASAVLCVLGDRLSKDVLAQCPNLSVISNVAVGFDNIDVGDATERGIVVTNTPGVLDNATADLAFSLLLACARRIIQCDKYVRDQKWTGWEDCLMAGSEITGKTLGIVGMGRIGEAMARRGRGFGMKIIYTRRGDEEKDKKLKKEFEAMRVSLGELLKNSDFVSIHCPLNSSTHHLIGRAELAQMKPGAFLINTARGAIIHETELVRALQEGRIAGAGLDVFETEPKVTEELMTMENVVLTPHVGSSTLETRNAMKALAVDCLISALSGIPPKHFVNKEAWTKFLSRMETVILPDEEESSGAEPQLSMPWN